MQALIRLRHADFGTPPSPNTALAISNTTDRKETALDSTLIASIHCRTRCGRAQNGTKRTAFHPRGRFIGEIYPNRAPMTSPRRLEVEKPHI